MLEANRKEDSRVLQLLQSNLESCIIGKTEEITLLVTAFLAGGHILLEDVPGTGKTVLIKALAKSIDGQFRRIQCNPDLLPTDITGVSIYHPKEQTFVFRPGPIMTHILLADEINRATTKTQSALLEAMEERHVTVDGECFDLPKPFILLATQNPIDFEGTYILPEAQLDRFMLKFSIGYPDAAAEKKMVILQSKEHPLNHLQAVTGISHIALIQQRVRDVHVDESLADYIIQIVRLTREHSSVFLGASPRATLSLIQAAKAYAYLHERDYVIPDDIKYLAPFVLSHRMIIHSDARMDGVTTESVLKAIFNQVRVPVRMEK